MKQDTSSKLLTGSLYAVVTLIPLLHLPGLNHSAFTAPKLLALRLITLFIVGVLVYRTFFLEKLPARPTGYLVILTGLTLSAVLSTVFSEYLFTSLFGSDKRFLGVFTMLNLFFLSYVAAYQVHDKYSIKRLITWSLGMSVLIALYALVQSTEWFYETTREFFKWNPSQNPHERAFATFGHSTHLAAYLGMHVMIGLGAISNGLLLTKKKEQPERKKLLILGVASVLILFAGIVVTASRGPLFAAVCGTLIWGSYTAFHHSIAFKKYFKQILITLLVLLGITTVSAPFVIQLPIVQRTLNTVEILQAGETIDRQSWWKSSFTMWQDRPFFGHGLSTFGDAYNKYRRTDYRIPEDEQDMTVPKTAHMKFFDVLATQGIVGLAAFILFIVFVSYTTVQFLRQKNSNIEKNQVISLYLAFVVFILHTLFGFGVLSTLTFFYLFAGLLIATTMPKDKVIPVKLSLKVLAIGAVIIATAYGYYGIRHYLADMALRTADSAPHSKAESLYQDALTLMPYEYTYYSRTGDFFLSHALQNLSAQTAKMHLKESISYYETALALNDSHPHIFSNKALAHKKLAKMASHEKDQVLLVEELKNAIVSFEEAIEAGPNNPVYYYDIAKFFYEFERYPEARDYYQKALALRTPYKESLYYLAKSHLQTNQFALALNAAERALEFEPQRDDLQNLLELIQKAKEKHVKNGEESQSPLQTDQ